MYAICLALALAIGMPVDVRPEWRASFAPAIPLSRPRPAEEREPGLVDRQGQITFRNCWPRRELVQQLYEAGYRLQTADFAAGFVYERWGRSDGQWRSTAYLPNDDLLCPLFQGGGWAVFGVPDR